jgi:hypothetical protein
MWQDPIVMETRALREQYANQFDHNADAIFQDILLRQAASGKKLVSFKHRKPENRGQVLQSNNSPSMAKV